MTRRYFIQYDAHIQKDHLTVSFQRLYRDGRDIMCDSLKPQWEPEDDFIIDLAKRITTRTTEIREDKVLGNVRIERENVETLETLRIHTESKQAANYIWFLAAKRGASFDDIKAMHEAKKF